MAVVLFYIYICKQNLITIIMTDWGVRYTIININLSETSFPELPTYLSCTTYTRKMYTLDNFVCLPNLSNKDGINI